MVFLFLLVFFLWACLYDLSLLGLLVNQASQLLDVTVESLDALVLASTLLSLEECALVDVAERAEEPPAKDLLVLALILFLNAVVWVLVLQDWVDVVI